CRPASWYKRGRPGHVSGPEQSEFQGPYTRPLQFTVLYMDLHPHDGAAHAFAQAVQPQAHGSTAAQSVLHHKIEAAQAGHVITGDVALDHAAKISFELFGGDLPLNDLVVLGLAGKDANVAGVALVAAAAVGDIVQVDLSHFISPPGYGFRC